MTRARVLAALVCMTTLTSTLAQMFSSAKRNFMQRLVIQINCVLLHQMEVVGKQS